VIKIQGCRGGIEVERKPGKPCKDCELDIVLKESCHCKELEYGMKGRLIKMTNKEFKPDCKLAGENGNILNLIGIAKEKLKRNGMREKGNELVNRIVIQEEAKSYDEVLTIIGEYINII
jgi:hypothetical protein